jgi:DNA-binding protein H-NS
MSVQELSSLIEKVQAKRAEKMDEARRALSAEFRETASQPGLPFESPMPGASGQGNAAKKKGAVEFHLQVKFKGPNGEKWSGRSPDMVAGGGSEGPEAERIRSLKAKISETLTRNITEI